MKRLLLLCAMLLPCAAHSFAQPAPPVPPTLTYQGRLAKPDGTPVPDTTSQSLTFSLFDALTGGNLLWTQTTPNVAVHNGAFSVKLDFSTGFQSGKTFNGTFATAGTTPFLQIQVGTDAPLAPRQPFAATPYAFVAGTVPDGSLTAAKFTGGVLTPGGNAGGDLTGTYPNPALATLFTSLGKVSGGLLSVSPAGASALDQQQTKTTSNISFGTTGATCWQSFTPAVTGNLNAIALFVGSANLNSQTAFLSLYQGEGTAGPRLLQGFGSIAPSLGFQTFPLGNTLSLQAGVRYTIALNGSNILWSGSLGNTYANGDAFAPAGVPADFDFAFQTTMQATNNLLAGAPLLINGGSIPALVAQSATNSGLNAAVVGVNNGSVGTGVQGISTGTGTGITGSAYGNGMGVEADAYGNGIGLEVIAFGNGDAIFADAAGTGYAGEFFGPVTISGNVSIGTSSPVYPLSFANGIGDKIEFSGNATGAHYGIGLQVALMQIHTANSGQDIAFGFGSSSAFTETMRIKGNGNLTVKGTVTANGVLLTSDARYKTNVQPLDHALEDVLSLRGVSYAWDRAAWKDKNFPEGRQVGFLAQELEKVLPELVVTDENGYKSVMYQNVTPVLVEAIKALNAKVDAQQKALDEKQRQLDALKSLCDTLQKQNATLAELAAKIERLEKQRRP